MSSNSKRTAEALKRLLRLEGVTVVELAALMDIPPKTLYNKFYRSTFTAEELIAIMDLLGVSLIIKGDGYSMPL